MSERTYAAIAPLVASQQRDANVLRVTFRCPQSGRIVTADAIIEERDTTGRMVGDVVKREAAWGLFRWVGDAVSSLFGGSTAANVAGNVAGEVTYRGVDNSRSFVFSEEEKQAAVLEAFGNVEEHFVFDEAAQRWVMRGA